MCIICLLLLLGVEIGAIWLIVSIALAMSHFIFGNSKVFSIIAMILSGIIIIAVPIIYIKKNMMAGVVISFTLVVASMLSNMIVTSELGRGEDNCSLTPKEVRRINYADEFGLGMGFISSGMLGVLMCSHGSGCK